MPRKKSRLERLLSFNQHRKRWGARRHALAVEDFGALKSTLISGAAVTQTRGSEKSLDQHLANLRLEFVGQPEIVFHHARLIVLIRREFNVEATFAQFKTLWDQEAAFLCAHLNLRWLVSASDTFADHHPEKAARAISMMAAALVNTVKIYETERLVATGGPTEPDPTKIEQLQTDLVPLFEGLSGFTIGTDDTLRNMRWRLEPFFEEGAVGQILKTVYDRLQTNDTAFARLRALHRRDRTGWW
jgi:hypothetical protein